MAELKSKLGATRLRLPHALHCQRKLGMYSLPTFEGAYGCEHECKHRCVTASIRTPKDNLGCQFSPAVLAEIAPAACCWPSWPMNSISALLLAVFYPVLGIQTQILTRAPQVHYPLRCVLSPAGETITVNWKKTLQVKWDGDRAANQEAGSQGSSGPCLSGC